MEKTYTIKTDSSGLTIELKPHQPLAIVLGLIVQVVIFAIIGFVVFRALLMLRSTPQENIFTLLFFMIVVILLGALIVLVLIVRAFVRKLTHYETIIVDSSAISIIEGSLVSKKTKKIDLKYIRQLYFIGAETFSPHPLDGEYGDIGFRGRQAVVNYAIASGTMMLVAGKHNIRFGVNMPSWDAEEIISYIEKYTGRSFSPKSAPDTEPEPRAEVRKFKGRMDI